MLVPFDWAMRKLNESGMRECLDDMVLNHDVPVLGLFALGCK